MEQGTKAGAGAHLDEAIVEEEADGGADGDGLRLHLLGHRVAHDALQVRAHRRVVVLPQLRRHTAGGRGREHRQERRQDPDPGAHPDLALPPLLSSPPRTQRSVTSAAAAAAAE